MSSENTLRFRPGEPTPVAMIGSDRGYAVPRLPIPTDLALDANEGPPPGDAILRTLQAVDAETLRRYPSAHALEEALADRFGVANGQVLVTAGGDDAIDRCCRAMLGPGRRVIIPQPTFIMIERSARLRNAEIVAINWNERAFPTDEIINAVDDRTALIAVVSPNNPTGLIAQREDLVRIAAAAPHAMIMLDAAYEEFTGSGLTTSALALPNVLTIRTFSKAFGLAGLRLGYAVGPEKMIRWLRAAGGPYPTSGLSIAIGLAALRTGPDGEYLARIRREREELCTLLTAGGGCPYPSEANFVAARLARADDIRTRLTERGIAVRGFPTDPALRDLVRMTCPGNHDDFTRLTIALREVLEIST